MKTKRLSIIAVFLLGIHLCVAQPSDLKSFKIFGDGVNGVQMSILLDTNSITAGALISVFAEIRNLSTNSIYMGETSPAGDFEVSLTDTLGTIYKLSGSKDRVLQRSLIMKINPNQDRDWIIPVSVGRSVKSGFYILEATRKFHMSGRVYSVKSNPLSVQVASR